MYILEEILRNDDFSNKFATKMTLFLKLIVHASGIQGISEFYETVRKTMQISVGREGNDIHL